MSGIDPRPPRPARWLLRARPLGVRRAEVEADLEELFVRRAGMHGRLRASRAYYRDVLSVWRWNPRGAHLVREGVQDVRHALRIYRRNPGAVAVGLLGLSLAIAVSTSVFSLLNAVVLRPIGIDDPAAAVQVLRAGNGGVSTSWPYNEYLSLHEASPSTAIEALLNEAARFSAAPAFSNDDDAPTVPLAFVSGTYLTTFGARVSHGRALGPQDDAATVPVPVVASHAFWLHELGGDPLAIGRALRLNGAPVTLIGVASPSFTGVAADPVPAFWVPLSAYHEIFSGSPLSRTSHIGVSVYGRTAKSMTLAASQSELGAVASALPQTAGAFSRVTGVRLDPAGSRFSGAEARLVALVTTLVLSTVGLIVLLACVNVANLQLASAVARQREIGVRFALGASRSRVVRQLLSESLVLGLIGGAAALLLIHWLVPALSLAVRMPPTVDASPDLRVYLFLTAVSMLAGATAGLAPALHGTRGDLVTPLKGEAPGGGTMRPGRLRTLLVGIQAAASVLLLVLASLLGRAMVRATSVDVGFDAHELVSVAASFGRQRYDAAYWNLVTQRLRARPEVAAASVALYLPYSGSIGVTIVDRGGTRYRSYVNETDAGYFSTLGLRILRGRSYTAAEVAAHTPVAVISETLARDFWPAEDPIGGSLGRFDAAFRSTTVIGVASNAITAQLRELDTAAIYRPLTHVESARILVRTRGLPEVAVPAVRDTLRSLDPTVRLDIGLVSRQLQQELDEPRILAALAGGLAALALALAVIGIYGVTALAVGQRRHEIGVRIAIGADVRDVLQLLLRDGLRPVAVGLAVGVAVALPATSLIGGILYGVAGHDPLAFAGAASVLLASAAIAIYVPTRRAARVDPVSVLRQS